MTALTPPGISSRSSCPPFEYTAAAQDAWDLRKHQSRAHAHRQHRPAHQPGRSRRPPADPLRSRVSDRRIDIRNSSALPRPSEQLTMNARNSAVRSTILTRPPRDALHRQLLTDSLHPTKPVSHVDAVCPGLAHPANRPLRRASGSLETADRHVASSVSTESRPLHGRAIGTRHNVWTQGDRIGRIPHRTTPTGARAADRHPVRQRPLRATLLGSPVGTEEECGSGARVLVRCLTRQLEHRWVEDRVGGKRPLDVATTESTTPS